MDPSWIPQINLIQFIYPLGSRYVLRYNPMTQGWDVSTINPTSKSGGVWILRDLCYCEIVVSDCEIVDSDVDSHAEWEPSLYSDSHQISFWLGIFDKASHQSTTWCHLDQQPTYWYVWYIIVCTIWYGWVDRANIPLFTEFYTSQVVHDFFHQQYVWFSMISSTWPVTHADVYPSSLVNSMTFHGAMLQDFPLLCPKVDKQIS